MEDNHYKEYELLPSRNDGSGSSITKIFLTIFIMNIVMVFSIPYSSYQINKFIFIVSAVLSGLILINTIFSFLKIKRSILTISIWTLLISFVLPFTYFYTYLLNPDSILFGILFTFSAVFLAFSLRDFIKTAYSIIISFYSAYTLYENQTGNYALSSQVTLTSILSISLCLYLAYSLFRQQKLINEKILFQKAISGSIAHELRTPIGIINNYATSYINDITSKINNKVDSDNITLTRSQIEQSIEYISKIKDICSESFFTIELLLNNLTQVKKKPLTKISIAEIIYECINTYPSDGLDSIIETNINDDFEVNGNPTLMKHVIYNLIKNAVRAISTSGKGKIFISVICNDNCNTVYFKDTASGIPQDKLEKIFELFYSGTSSGSGLGLFICKQIVEFSGGSISCKSQLGVYTEFTINFPNI